MKRPNGSSRRVAARLAATSVLLVAALPAWAWKVTTHQVAAVRAADRLPEGLLRSLLLANEVHLRAGAMGPDLFLLSGGGARFSNLAHYCKTDDLAKNMLSRSKTRSPGAQAFAYGWFSHNITDSVAHPWVNGFTGQPYVDYSANDPKGAALNVTHLAIETWVDKQVFSQMGTTPADRYSQAKSLVEAFDPYFEEEIQELFIEAYDATYEGKGDCISRDYRSPTKPEIVAAAKRFKAAITGDKFGPVVKDVVDPKIFDIDLSKLVADAAIQQMLATWEDYVNRSVQYTTKAWPGTEALPNLNLDQGVAPGNVELRNAWAQVLDRDNNPVGVFDVPGKAYNDGKIPDYQPRCKEPGINPSCSQQPGSQQPGNKPGGDYPDDAVTQGTAVAVPTGSPAEGSWRLATKKGKKWPSIFERLARQAEGLGSITDPALFVEAFAAQGEAYDRARQEDPEFGAMTSSYHGDTRPVEGSADIALLQEGFFTDARRTTEGWLEPVRPVGTSDVSPELLRSQPVLLVPTGGLYGLFWNDEFKAGLESYVAAGGTVLVFAQQRGSDFSVLPTPDGRPIQGWGWFEDNSCYSNGAYVDTFHPILASQSKALVTSNIDGYFDDIPEESTVLLRRVKNGQPSMFLYPYGQGWVIVTSSYDDWGGFNQTTPGARAIVRDAIAWAKKPAELPLHAPGSTATVAVQVKNVTDVAASQVKLVLMSPSRNVVVAETTVSASVAAGGTGEVEFSHGFPVNAGLGIYHVDYELLDASGVTIQPVAEDDSGRIAVAKPAAEPYRPEAIGISIVMPDGEDIVQGAIVRYRYRLTNPSDHDRTLRLWREFRHQQDPDFVGEVTVPAQGAYEAELFAEVEWNTLWIHVFEPGGTVANGWPHFVHFAQETGAWQVSGFKRGFRKTPRATLTVVPDRPAYLPGEPVTILVTVRNDIPLAWNGVASVVGRSPGGVEVFRTEQPLSLAASATAAFQVPASLSENANFWVAMKGGGRWAGSAGPIPVRFTRPALRSVALTAPAWSRTSSNPVTWSVENAEPVWVNAGTLRAILTNGVGTTVWEEVRAVTLNPGPAARADLVVDVPAIPAAIGNGSLSLSLEDGYGKRMEQRLRVRSDLRIRVDFDALSYDAGSAGELRLTLLNQGTLPWTLPRAAKKRFVD